MADGRTFALDLPDTTPVWGGTVARWASTYVLGMLLPLAPPVSPEVEGDVRDCSLAGP